MENCDDQKDGAVSMFNDEHLGGMSGMKRGRDFIEVMCGCTSQRYGDAVGRLKVSASGDLEISCECTPGCHEGKLYPLNERATRTIRNLYVENERVVLEGQWKE